MQLPSSSRVLRPAHTRLLLALSLALAGGCAGAPARPASEPYTPPPAPDEESIGYFLANYDKSLRAWNNLSLSQLSPADERELLALEDSLRDRAKRRQQELIDVLENDAPSNREVAAVALGFTDDPAVLSPLLSALNDTEPAVVQKALLGLGLLGDPATPLAEPIFLLERAPDAWTRNNAAFALVRLAAAGARDPDLAEAARSGLFDSEAGVRAQCASVLGILADAGAVPDLASLLEDDAALVSRAGAQALARIGQQHLETKGEVARSLVDALARVERRRRPFFLAELRTLAGRDFGEDPKDWRAWAYRMP